MKDACARLERTWECKKKSSGLQQRSRTAQFTTSISSFGPYSNSITAHCNFPFCMRVTLQMLKGKRNMRLNGWSAQLHSIRRIFVCRCCLALLAGPRKGRRCLSSPSRARFSTSEALRVLLKKHDSRKRAIATADRSDSALDCSHIELSSNYRAQIMKWVSCVFSSFSRFRHRAILIVPSLASF